MAIITPISPASSSGRQGFRPSRAEARADGRAPY